MAEATSPKPTTNYYKNLGGVNAKASMYELSIVQFLNLRNVDFDVPNALQKRPGSSLFSTQSLSAPVISLFEYQKLLTTNQVPSDYIMANANGNVFYNTPQSATLATSFTLLSQGWGATQPVDFLTFVNKLWMANGTKWEWFNGSSLYPAGLRVPPAATLTPVGNGAASYLLVAGLTMTSQTSSSASLISVQVWAAYSEVRSDGYYGPCDFFQNPTGLINRGAAASSGVEWFASNRYISGFSVSPAATAIAIWVAMDRQVGASSPPASANYCPTDYGLAAPVLANINQFGGAGSVLLGPTLVANPDPTKFLLYTLVPASTATFNFIGLTSWSQFLATNPQSFSGMIGDFFATFSPKYIEVSNNRMFFSGFSSSPSQVQFSEVGDPETIEPESNFETRTNDGDRIFALTAYNNQVIIMKENSFHKLVGDSPDNYQLVQISDQYGCLSNQSVVQYDQKCLWLDRKGILEYNGANNTIISGAIEPIFRRMNVTAAQEYAVGVHHRYRNQIWWGIPVDGSTINNLTVVYDYLVNGWTFFDGFNPASFSYIKGNLTKLTAWRGDYTGFVHFTGESFFSDSGQGISCVALTRFESAGENNTFIWRRFFADVATANGLTGVINGKVYSDYNTQTVQATFQIYQDQFQSRAEMGVVGKAVACEVSHHSASLPLLFNGYSWTRRGLRNL